MRDEETTSKLLQRGSRGEKEVQKDSKNEKTESAAGNGKGKPNEKKEEEKKKEEERPCISRDKTTTRRADTHTHKHTHTHTPQREREREKPFESRNSVLPLPRVVIGRRHQEERLRHFFALWIKRERLRQR